MSRTAAAAIRQPTTAELIEIDRRVIARARAAQRHLSNCNSRECWMCDELGGWIAVADDMLYLLDLLNRQAREQKIRAMAEQIREDGGELDPREREARRHETS